MLKHLARHRDDQIKRKPCKVMRLPVRSSNTLQYFIIRPEQVNSDTSRVEAQRTVGKAHQEMRDTGEAHAADDVPPEERQGRLMKLEELLDHFPSTSENRARKTHERRNSCTSRWQRCKRQNGSQIAHCKANWGKSEKGKMRLEKTLTKLSLWPTNKRKTKKNQRKPHTTPSKTSAKSKSGYEW